MLISPPAPIKDHFAIGMVVLHFAFLNAGAGLLRDNISLALLILAVLTGIHFLGVADNEQLNKAGLEPPFEFGRQRWGVIVWWVAAPLAMLLRSRVAGGWPLSLAIFGF